MTIFFFFKQNNQQPQLYYLFQSYQLLKYINLQIMINQNILEDCQNQSTSNTRAKLSYLQSQKTRLEYIVAQLQQKINLQRFVTSEIAKNNNNQPNALQAALIQQNSILQQHYLRIYKQNLQLGANHLLLQQIIDENQIEYHIMLTTYEDKIIELRRSIQSKESFIQQLESRTKASSERFIAPATNVTMLFFNQIEDLKKVIASLTSRNKQLQTSNQKILMQYQQAQKRLLLLQSLTTKSKLMFQQFKHLYSSSRNKTYSTPKKDTCIPFDQKQCNYSSKKLNEAHTRQTRQFSEELTNINDSSLKMIIYKQYLEIDTLKQALEQSKVSLKSSEKSKKYIVNSYNKELNRIHQLVNELNYYKKSTQDLLKLISCRKYYPSKSQERSTSQQLISNIKSPKETTYITDRKRYWLGVQKSIKLEKLNILRVKRKYHKIYRSLSCVIDYRQMGSDQVEKYLNKKQSNYRSSKKMEEQKSNDFSVMIQGSLDADFTIIQPSKRTYTDWKHGAKKGAVNLTIIEQNLL